MIFRLYLIKICLDSLCANHSGFYRIVKEYNDMIEKKGINERYLIDY